MMSIVTTAWSMVRQQNILRKHRKVAAFWNQMMDKDRRGMLQHFPLQAKTDLPENKVIWQYWGQGITQEHLPAVVQMCFHSVDTYCGDYTVIRVDDNSLAQYLDLPDFIWAKRKADLINRTFFSDMIRLALLQVYGGVWLDATILMTGQLPEIYLEQDYFVYQRDPHEPNVDYWENSYAYYWGWHAGYKVNMLNSIIFAKKGHPLVADMCHLLFNYWKEYDDVLDYFFFQILHEQLLISGQGYQNKLLVSDVNPHLLQTKLSGGSYPITYEEIFVRTSLHKLTYFTENTVVYFKQILHQMQTGNFPEKDKEI